MTGDTRSKNKPGGYAWEEKPKLGRIVRAPVCPGPVPPRVSLRGCEGILCDGGALILGRSGGDRFR